MGVNREPGLRERKKARTRRAISDVAMRLFADRGFEGVTVAEVAEAAEVSLSTVFNYFPTKEDLFFDRQEDIEQEWSRVVRERGPGESVVTALRRHYFEALERREPRSGIAEGLATFHRIIEESPALRAREREIGERSAEALAHTLAEEVGADPDDIIPRVVASQVAGVYGALYNEGRRRLLAGQGVEEAYPFLVRAARRAFDLLENGVGDYCIRPG